MGLGSSSSLSSVVSESSSSMISLQRSMHSSQMYTPGPAMSFFTCFCDFPQKEHFSRSPPSPMRATYDQLPVSADRPASSLIRRYMLNGLTEPLRRRAAFSACRDRNPLAALEHLIDEAVLLGL